MKAGIGPAVGVGISPPRKLGTTLAPLGSTFGGVGDGISSNAAAGGLRNMFDWFLIKMGGRVVPVPDWKVTASGTTIARTVDSNTPWQLSVGVPILAAQKPDISLFGPMGSNDNVLSVDPTGNVWMQDWKDALTAHVAANPSALLIPVMGTWPSGKAGEATWRAAALAVQAAHAASFGDPRIVWIDTSSVDPANMSPSTDSSKVHPDERGAILGSDLLYNAISPRVVAADADTILGMIHGNTYPGLSTQADTDRALAGTAGTATNFTGSVATSKVANNGSGLTGVASKVSTSGGREKQVLTLTGTVGTEGVIYFEDKSNNAVTMTKGQTALIGMKAVIPAGFASLGGEWGNFGQLMTYQGGANTGVTAGTTQGINGVVIIPALPAYANTTSATAKRRISARYRVGAAPGVIEFEQPFLARIDHRTRHQPYCVGNTFVGATQRWTTNYRLRLTGTLSSGAGTLTVEPGAWAPHGLTEADFVQRRIYKGGTSAVGSGTLVATLSGSTWTWVTSGIIAGDNLWTEVDANNGIGGTVTARSQTAYVAA